MPRKARKKSNTGIYHIILRGSNKREIFHDDQDCLRFLETVEHYKLICQIEVYGWCLMGNHIHLLIKEGNESLDITMKRIGVSYAWFYNFKYETTGHLFQDRFHSENIEDEKYLLTVIRYIHQNPIKAGITNCISDWKWSSCIGYYTGRVYPLNLLDADFILGIFSDQSKIAIEKFKNFNEEFNDTICLDNISQKRLSDQQARNEILKLNLRYNIPQIKELSRDERDRVIRMIKGIEGISQRQITRIIGIPQSLISKI